jgi:hypothetical protein
MSGSIELIHTVDALRLEHLAIAPCVQLHRAGCGRAHGANASVRVKGFRPSG